MLEVHGIIHPGHVYWNPSVSALYSESIRRGEGSLAEGGPLVCSTGIHTGRSPNDKFIVQEPSTEEHVWWGTVNRALDRERFGLLQLSRRHQPAGLRLRALRRDGALAGRGLRPAGGCLR